MRGVKGTKLNWILNPVPSIHFKVALKRPSTLQNPSAFRKASKVRIFQEDELALFNKKDIITLLDDLTKQHYPPDYAYHKLNNAVVFYKLVFQENGVPFIEEATKVKESLTVAYSYSLKANLFKHPKQPPKFQKICVSSICLLH